MQAFFRPQCIFVQETGFMVDDIAPFNKRNDCRAVLRVTEVGIWKTVVSVTDLCWNEPSDKSSLLQLLNVKIIKIMFFDNLIRNFQPLVCLNEFVSYTRYGMFQREAVHSQPIIRADNFWYTVSKFYQLQIHTKLVTIQFKHRFNSLFQSDRPIYL